MGRVTDGDVHPLDYSALALSVLRAEADGRISCGDEERDSLLYVVAGDGVLELGERHELVRDDAALVLAGEEAEIQAGDAGIAVLRATVGPDADRHAPLDSRATLVRADSSEAGDATGARSFRVLLGPHNGSTRATMFLGCIPPGRAPWHYHLYDEIVWVPEGPGMLHLDGEAEELLPGSAFRLRPREVHIVENSSADREMTVLGVFTPAGSPSAAYLTDDVAESYRFSP